MNTKIIPEIKEIVIATLPLALTQFTLHDDIITKLPIAQEIWSDIPSSGTKVITYQEADLADEAYTISAKQDSIVITAKDTKGLMYGLYTLVELYHLNDGALVEFSVTDEPDLKFRGWSDDLSRGQVSNTNNFFEIIRRLARYKYNTYMPYIEDTFKFDSVPAWGRYSDPVSKKEWCEIIAYAKKYHVQMRPIINLLGHFDKGCYIEELQSLSISCEKKKVSDVLDPKKDSVKTLIKNMLDEIVEVFGEGIVHCGGDEPVELTTAYGHEEGGSLFIQHYSFISEELKKRNCTLMMYADFFAPAWGDYSIPADRAKELPDGTNFVFWDYAPREAYPNVDALHEQGLNTYISPGTWNWNRCCLDIHCCYNNTKGLLKADNRRSLGMIMSSWADGGDGLRELAWLGVSIGANFCWRTSSEYSYEDIYDTYHKSFFGFDAKEAKLLEPIYHHDTIIKRKDEYEVKAELFKSPFELITFEDKDSIDTLINAMAKTRSDYQSLTPLRNHTAFAALLYTIEVTDFIAHKVKYLPNAKVETIEEGITYSDRAMELATRIEQIKNLHKKLWFNTNRFSEWSTCEAIYEDQRDLLLIFARNVKLRRFHQKNWWNKHEL